MSNVFITQISILHCETKTSAGTGATNHDLRYTQHYVSLIPLTKTPDINQYQAIYFRREAAKRTRHRAYVSQSLENSDSIEGTIKNHTTIGEFVEDLNMPNSEGYVSIIITMKLVRTVTVALAYQRPKIGDQKCPL